MLQKDPQHRLAIKQIRQHDWVRKKHPRITQEVCIPHHVSGDEFRSMSVIPYLQDLHCGPEEGDEASEEYITEHDLQEMRQMDASSSKKRNKKPKRKLPSCISVKRFSSCKQS
ncbi:serine/threonine-protein kinase stk11-like [Tachypleus tridentatus]|uniref:serine/threonine-protein kinase stk11-like n=1 Tax=Tachypleus tridentatus TaxID=6853 RepID=UPI003FD3B184